MGGGDDVTRVEKAGREYLSFPVVAAREMVMNYPEFGRKELLPADSFQKTADLWAGQPITAKHPRENTAKSPDAYAETVYGQVHQPEADDEKLRARAMVDVEKANSLGGAAQRVVERLEAGKEVAVSTGYDTVGDKRENGTYGGESYDLVQGDVIPDHLAVFPPDEFRARCSLEDGCGAPRANAVLDDELAAGAFDSGGSDAGDLNHMTDDDPIDPSTAHRVLSLFGYGNGSGDAPRSNAANDSGGHDDCGCGGECGDCGGAGRGNTDPDDGDSSDADSDTDDNDMPDNDIETLAERTAFSAEQLQSWDDEEIDALEQTVEADAPTGDGGDDAGTQDADGSTDTQTTDANDDGPTTDAAADGGNADTATAGGADKENATEELASVVSELKDEVSELKQNYVESEHEEEIRTVTNAVDDMTEDDARALAERNPAALESLAAEHREEPRANYGGIPGSVDRTPDKENAADEYPTPGRDFGEAGGD